MMIVQPIHQIQQVGSQKLHPNIRIPISKLLAGIPLMKRKKSTSSVESKFGDSSTQDVVTHMLATMSQTMIASMAATEIVTHEEEEAAQLTVEGVLIGRGGVTRVAADLPGAGVARQVVAEPDIVM
jgi:hypothetical protein